MRIVIPLGVVDQGVNHNTH